MIKTEYLLITPETAKQMLEKNTKNNRSVRPSHVAWLAGMIERGEFTTTHQGIAFAENGDLIDGQHRLHAIVKANRAVVMSVTTGLDNKAFDSFDIGIKRTMYDLTNINRQVVEALSFVFYNQGETLTRVKPSPKEIEAIYNTKLGKMIEDINSQSFKHKRFFGSCGVKTAAASCILIEDNYDYVIEQYAALHRGDFDKMNNVSKSLYRMHASGSIKATGSSGSKEAFWRAYQCFSKNFYMNTTNRYSEQNSMNIREVLQKAIEVK